MRADEMTFGVEIETHMPVGRVVVGGYHAGRQVDWLPAGWRASRDGSLHGYGPGREGVEFVSPILRGQEGLDQVIAVVKKIKEMGGKVNASCGVHVHVGFDKRNLHVLAHLVALVGHHEHGIYAITGTKQRERGHYCKPMKQYGTNANYRARASRDRYHLLNLATREETVEFRAFAGTLNVFKIIGAINICLGLVEKAYGASRRATWSPRQFRGLGANGFGTKEAKRLFKRLGWTGTTSGHPAGMSVGGRLRRVVQELMKMAQQYDSQH